MHVLKDINLTVTKGEVLVVVGPSGSGKSTMCRTINRLETIDSGDIRIDGKPLPQEGKELANLRAEVGMVFQSFNLFANKTILENVTLALIKVRHMDKKEAEQLAMDLLAVMVELAHEGMTMICVTHEMGFARKAADRIVFMADGQILEENTPDEFFEHPQTDRAKDFLSKILTH